VTDWIRVARGNCSHATAAAFAESSVSKFSRGIEVELRKSSGNPKFVMADYFDHVGGTSTGAIIATLIALGHSADEVRDFYLRSGAEMFHKARLWERFRTKFEDDKLSQMLRDVIGEDTTLGSEKLRTLLMMVLRNATTDSPWPLTNNPAAKYNDATRPGCNPKVTTLAACAWALRFSYR
jgi:hypothetical protein